MHRFGMIDLMLLPFTVIMIKSRSDILQGVSKLDDMVRCSVFQKDKIDSTRSQSDFSENFSNKLSSDRTSSGSNRVKNRTSLMSRDYAYVLASSSSIVNEY